MNDFLEWERELKKFALNKKNLNFNAHAKLSEDGKISFYLDGIEAKYEKATRALMLKISQGAVYYMNKYINPDYVILKDDYEDEQKKCNLTIQNSFCLIPLIFEDSECFFNILNQKYEMLKLQYLLSKIKYEDGEWRLNNSVWKDYGWINSDGVLSTDTLCQVWKTILN